MADDLMVYDIVDSSKIIGKVKRSDVMNFLRNVEVSEAVHVCCDVDKTDDAMHHTLTLSTSSTAQNPHQAKHG